LMAEMKACDMAPVACEAMTASALFFGPKRQSLLLFTFFAIPISRVTQAEEKRKTHEVWSSLLPLHMMTSAGDVLVRLVCS